MKISEIKQLIKETIDEMARTPGTGAKVKITDKGESAVKQIVATKELPTGMTNNRFKVLKALYMAKKNGKEGIQKTDIAAELGTTQQGVNGDYNWLRSEGYAEDTAYTPKGKATPSNPRQSIDDLLAGLDGL
jgi:predicted transcriptional regulator